MKKFIVALQFLTILPVQIKNKIEDSDFGAALAYFPVVGLLIGFILAAGYLFLGYFPELVRVTLVLMLSILVSGGIHLDGFADACDGFYAGRSKEKILEIMRDPHLGTMGVIGIVSIILLKFSILLTAPSASLLQLLIAMPVFSRCVQVISCYFGYARQEGKAGNFIGQAQPKQLLISLIFTTCVLIILLGVKGVILAAVSLLQVLVFIVFVKRKINGMTGDTIGAASEIAEVAILFFSLIILR